MIYCLLLDSVPRVARNNVMPDIKLWWFVAVTWRIQDKLYHDIEIWLARNYRLKEIRFVSVNIGTIIMKIVKLTKYSFVYDNQYKSILGVLSETYAMVPFLLSDGSMRPNWLWSICAVSLKKTRLITRHLESGLMFCGTERLQMTVTYCWLLFQNS